MSSQDILVIQKAIMNRFILVVVKSANVGELGVANAFTEGLNSSLTISTLACSGEFSSDKTQQLFTIVSTCCISLNMSVIPKIFWNRTKLYIWVSLATVVASNSTTYPGHLNFLWVVTDAQLDYCGRVGHKYGGAH